MRKDVLYQAERRMGSVAGPVGKDGHYRGEAPVLYDKDGKRRTDTTNLFAGTRPMSNGTSCGLLPGVVLGQYGIKLNTTKVKDITRYVTSGGPGGLEDLGRRFEKAAEKFGTKLDIWSSKRVQPSSSG